MSDSNLVALIAESEVDPGFRKVFEEHGIPLLLIVDDNSDYWLMHARCPHMGTPLGPCTIDEGVVMCPHHRFKFDLNQQGVCVTQGVMCDNLPTLSVVIDDGNICYSFAELADWL